MLTNSIMAALEGVGILLCILSCLVIGYIVGRQGGDAKTGGREDPDQKEKKRERLAQTVVELSTSLEGEEDADELVSAGFYFWFSNRVEDVAKRAETKGCLAVGGAIDDLAFELEEAVEVVMKLKK